MRSPKWTILLSAGLLIAGSAGYFTLQRGTWPFYAFAHLGALGVVGLLACLAGRLAKTKLRGYWTAFLAVTVLSIASGVVAVLAVFWSRGGELCCGGSVSLPVAILVIAVYALTRKRSPLPIS